MDDDYNRELGEDNDHNNYWSIVGAVIGTIITLAILFPAKFEGMTAKEWFNEYDYCVNQVVQANDRLEEANLEPVEVP